MISRLYYTSLNTLNILLISQNILLLLLMIIEKLLRSQEMRSLELLGCSKSWLINWFQVKSGMSSKSRLLLRCAHPLKERNEGHEAIIILRFTEFLHQALCFFLSQLLTNLGEKLTKEEAKGLMKELCEPEDDDGFMAFIPFLERMC